MSLSSIALIALGALSCIVTLGLSEEVQPQIIGKVGSKTFSISPEQYGENAPGRTWADALTYCQRAGKLIASVETKAEHDFLKNFLLGEAKENREHNVWTAGTDYFTEGKWYWITSRRPVDLSVSESSSPNADDTNNAWYNCLYLNAGGGLKSIYCAIPHARALCQ